MNKIRYYDKPVLFYFLSTFITWGFWDVAAKLSHMGSHYNTLCGIFLLLGLISLAIIRFIMIRSNNNLRGDFFSRLFCLPTSKPIYTVLAFCLMPLTIVLAQFISLFFGYSTQQFSLSQEPSFS